MFQVSPDVKDDDINSQTQLPLLISSDASASKRVNKTNKIQMLEYRVAHHDQNKKTRLASLASK